MVAAAEKKLSKATKGEFLYSREAIPETGNLRV
jgi:hypothetical protein